MPIDETRDRYEESLDILFTALEQGRVLATTATSTRSTTRMLCRGRRASFRVFLGGTSDRTYELAAERGWAVVVPPLLPYAALKEQLDLYRSKCAEHGTEP